MIKEELNIIKVGGAVVEDEESLTGLLMSFSSLEVTSPECMSFL